MHMPLETLNLPAVLRAAAELVEAAACYRPEDHPDILAAQAAPCGTPRPSVASQLHWHEALDAIRDAANRLKRALGATGELRPGRVRAEATPAAWRHLDSEFQDLDYARSVRVGLRRMALAAVDLSGYAELKQPPEEWRQQALAQLGRGVVQVWPALAAEERGEAQPLLPTFQQAFGWPDGPDHAPPAWSGPVELAAEEEYRIIDLGSYCTRPKEHLNELAQVPARQAAVTGNHPQNAPAANRAAEAQPRPKRSTAKGEGRAKLIAALTRHHDYAGGGAMNTEPINNNELARQADVDKATASVFFEKEFGGHTKYKNYYCANAAVLVAALKKLNDDYTADELFGGKPPGERESDDE
jgi:hypothetical protein